MKRLLVGIAIVLILPLLFSGCGQVNPGTVTSRDYDFGDFSKIEVSSTFEVEIAPSTTWSIEVIAQEKLFNRINVTKNGDTLEISVRSGWWGWVSSWGFDRPTARITMPELTGLNISGASKGNAHGFRSSQDRDIIVSGASSLETDIEAAYLQVEVSGASRIEGSLKADEMKAEISGASRAQILGSANSLILEVSGASTADLEGLIAQNVDVNVSGASRATISPEGTMKVTVTGASSLTYTGNPALEAIEVSGGSSIHKK